jgi:hypothetical protein
VVDDAMVVEELELLRPAEPSAAAAGDDHGPDLTSERHITAG